MEPSSSSSPVPSPLKEEDIPSIPISAVKLTDTADGDPRATEATTASVVQDPDRDADAGQASTDGQAGGAEDGAGEEGEEEEEEEEPKLKYVRLTPSMGNVYRNGDATSTAVVAGDKLIIGTHNGNIHILSLPSLHPLLVYHAHTASVTSLSVSPPIPPPSSAYWHDNTAAPTASSPLHIATSSLDGYTCITNLQDLKNASRTNFSRPVSAIALSPTFKHDRLFLSGGRAGNLIVSTATPNTTSTASLGSQTGGSWLPWGGGSKDTILHSGEGAVSTIAWSRVSPRFVVWANESSIKIMRSHITTFRGDRIDRAGEWRRISAIERPEEVPEEMAASWKVRVEWIDLETLEKRAEEIENEEGKGKGHMVKKKKIVGHKIKRGGGKERLLLGWGPVIWVIDVYGGDGFVIHASPSAKGKAAVESNEGRAWGWAEIVHVVQTDCTIAGLTLYNPSQVLFLAYLTAEKPKEPEESEEATTTTTSSLAPRRRIAHRANALAPELRIVDLVTASEISADSLMMSRYETLSANDYHLSFLPPTLHPSKPPSRGVLSPEPPSSPNQGGPPEGGVGVGSIWNAGIHATTLFSSGASILSRSNSFSTERAGSSKGGDSTPRSSLKGLFLKSSKPKSPMEGRENVPGWKIYISSPYDCIFATERGKKDRLNWLLDRHRFAEAWNLVDRYPDIISESAIVDDTDEDGNETDDISIAENNKSLYSAPMKEKRRIGELWLGELVREEKWEEAAEVSDKVLDTSPRWESWIWVFLKAGKLREITPHVPIKELRPPIPTLPYDTILGKYLDEDWAMFEALIQTWPSEIYDNTEIAKAVQKKLKDRGEAGLKKGQVGWRRLHNCLAILYTHTARHTEALKEYIMLKNAEEAIKLAKEYNILSGAIRGHVAEWLWLGVDDKMSKSASKSELEAQTKENVQLLVHEGWDHEGSGITMEEVVKELKSAEELLLLFFYLKELWVRDKQAAFTGIGIRGRLQPFGDLIVASFAEYDRGSLMEFLQTSEDYDFEKAVKICERRRYIDELVYLYSLTGQTKRALFLIINEKRDVAAAIDFAKTRDDPELWNDLLEYGMDKPPFILGLLEHVGTSLDPIKLVKRIPNGLEVSGLKEGLTKMLREHEIQWSLSAGVARCLSGEVNAGMDRLRTGRRRGVKFDIVAGDAASISTVTEKDEKGKGKEQETELDKLKSVGNSGCGICKHVFEQHEPETLVAFACGHVFHLRCLLKKQKWLKKHPKARQYGYRSEDEGVSDEDEGEEEEEDAIEKIIFRADRAMADAADQPDYGGLRIMSVAEKVTRAALIRQKIDMGCPLEVKRMIL
ncbi:Vacuolar protein-sorting-associated protein [Drechslerella dactyloides]|uniref:Vacuolar protein-sorting-associated protein n=1 Tax=Drechslerella dactyloides TaxID=74499 RepID=A0AAD6J1E5_DREDA|nr:Vacuolar protein-sorting-associated protein [Drechslerella dactyloides]